MRKFLVVATVIPLLIAQVCFAASKGKVQELLTASGAAKNLKVINKSANTGIQTNVTGQADDLVNGDPAFAAIEAALEKCLTDNLQDSDVDMLIQNFTSPNPSQDLANNPNLQKAMDSFNTCISTIGNSQ